MLPLSDTLSIGGSAAIYRRDGYGENQFTGNQNHYAKSVDAFRMSAEWNPTDALSFRLAADYVEDNSDAKHGHREAPGLGLAAGEVVLPDVFDTRGGIGDDNLVRNQGVSLTAAWELTDAITLKSITAYREGVTHTLIDFDTSPAPALDVPGYYEDDQLTQELQFLYEGERLRGVAGLYYLDAHAAGKFDTIVGLLNLTIATSGFVDTTSYAAYADFSYDFTDKLSASLGGRYTSDEKEGGVYRQNFTGLYSPLFGNDAAVPGLVRSDYTNDRTFDQFTPRASVSYEFTDTFTTYASYSEGFKSGGFDMRGDVVLTPDTVNGYDPETVQSYEIGAKGTLFDDRLSYNFAAFYADYSDQQITRQQPTVTGSIASFVDNAGASTIQGVELEGSVAVQRPILAELRRRLDGCGIRQVRDVPGHHESRRRRRPRSPCRSICPIRLCSRTRRSGTATWRSTMRSRCPAPGARCSRRCPARTATRTTCSNSRIRSSTRTTRTPSWTRALPGRRTTRSSGSSCSDVT